MLAEFAATLMKYPGQSRYSGSLLPGDESSKHTRTSSETLS